MAAPRVIKLQVVCSPYARGAAKHYRAGTARPADPDRAQRGEKIGPGRPDRPTQAARSAAKILGRDGPTDRPCRAQRGENLGRDCPDRPTLSRPPFLTFNEQSTSHRLA